MADKRDADDADVCVNVHENVSENDLAVSRQPYREGLLGRQERKPNGAAHNT